MYDTRRTVTWERYALASVYYALRAIGLTQIFFAGKVPFSYSGSHIYKILNEILIANLETTYDVQSPYYIPVN